MVYLDHSGELGGAEHLLLRLLADLPIQWVDALLICGRDGPFPQKAVRLGIATRIVHLPRFRSVSLVISGRKVLNPFALALNGCIVLYSSFRIARALRSERVDVVQTNSDFAHIFGGLAARWIHVPCLWFFHDLVERDRLGGLFAWMWRSLARRLNCKVAAVSQAVLRALGVDSLARVIYAGYPQDPHDRGDLRSKLHLSHEDKLVGFVGRIAYTKGIDVLIRSAVEVLKRDTRVHFVVIGGIPSGEVRYRSRLERMVQDTGLANRWHWFGQSPNTASLIPDLDLVVLPSRREALPLVLLEAGIAGKACVASRVGGIPEIIVDGETGILVPPEDPEQLASSITKLLGNPELTAVMGAKAGERVRRVFDPKQFEQQFLSLYQSLDA